MRVTCALCSGATHARTILGVSGWSCEDCGSMIFDANAVERLVGSTPKTAIPAPLSASVPSAIAGDIAPAARALQRRISDPRPQDQVTAPPTTSSVKTWVMAGATLVVVFALAVPLSWMVYQTVRSYVGPGAVSTATVVVPRPLQASQAFGALDEAAEEAWRTLELSPGIAAEAFRLVLEGDPNHASARHGLGVALLALGNPEPATVHLCRALLSGDATIRGEVQSLLDSNQLDCSS